MNDAIMGRCIRLPWREWAIRLAAKFEIGRQLNVRVRLDANRTREFECRVVMANRECSLAEIRRPEGWYFDSADGTRAVCWSQSSQAVWSGKITGVNVLTTRGDLFVHRTRVNATVSVLHHTLFADRDIRLVVAQIIDRGPPIIRPKAGAMISDFARVRMPAVGVDEVSAVAAQLESGNFGFLPTRFAIASDEFRNGASGALFDAQDDGYDELELSEYRRAQQELQREKADWYADWSRYVSDNGFEDGIDDDHWYVSDYGYSDGVDSGYW